MFGVSDQSYTAQVYDTRQRHKNFIRIYTNIAIHLVILQKTEMTSCSLTLSRNVHTVRWLESAPVTGGTSARGFRHKLHWPRHDLAFSTWGWANTRLETCLINHSLTNLQCLDFPTPNIHLHVSTIVLYRIDTEIIVLVYWSCANYEIQ